MAFTSDFSAEDSVLLARVDDADHRCSQRNTPCFVGFFDERQRQVVQQHMQHGTVSAWSISGGIDDAERTMVGFFPNYMDPEDAAFPLRRVAFRYRREAELTHRDLLGTLMAAGIRREKIGDILCGIGISVVILHEDIAKYICGQIQKIGGEGVQIDPDYTGELPRNHAYLDLEDTIASPRLDAVVKALLRCSRGDAAEKIVAGLVSLDHWPVQSVSAVVPAQCVISVKGEGRFLVDQIGPVTKKGRYVIKARKCL